MNAIDLLMQDHRKVEKLFSDFQTADAERRNNLLREIEAEVMAHTEAEETSLYPLMKPHATKQVEHSVDEHSTVKRLLAGLHSADIDQDGFPSKFAELMKNVQEHIRKEEGPGGLLALAHQRLTERALSKLGDHIQQVKEKVRERHPEPLPRAS